MSFANSSLSKPNPDPPWSASLLSKLRDKWQTYLVNALIGTPLIAGALIMFLPLVWSVSFSFGQPHEFFKLPPPVIPSAIRLDNYESVFQRVDFARFFLNSVAVTTCVTLAQLITCSMAGYAFARLRFPGKRLIFILFLASMMVPQHVTLIPVFIIIRGLGLYNSLGALIVPYAASVFGTFLLKQFSKPSPTSWKTQPKSTAQASCKFIVLSCCRSLARHWQRSRFSPSTAHGTTSFGP